MPASNGGLTSRAMGQVTRVELIRLQMDEAYRFVQKHALRAWDEELDFRTLVEGDPRIAGRIDADRVFDLGAYTHHVDAVFERLHALIHNEEAVHA